MTTSIVKITKQVTVRTPIEDTTEEEFDAVVGFLMQVYPGKTIEFDTEDRGLETTDITVIVS